MQLTVKIGRSKCSVEPDSFSITWKELILDRVEALAETAARSEVRTRRCSGSSMKPRPQVSERITPIGIVLVRVVDLFWLIAPEFHQQGVSVSWLDVVLPLSLGAVWLGCFFRQLRGRPILPVHDPEFDEILGPIIERGTPPRTAH